MPQRRQHPVRRLILNRPLMHVAIRQAAAIVTVSHSARRDLLRLHGTDPDRVSVVHEAASPAFRHITDRAALDAAYNNSAHVGMDKRNRYMEDWTARKIGRASV